MSTDLERLTVAVETHCLEASAASPRNEAHVRQTEDGLKAARLLIEEGTGTVVDLITTYESEAEPIITILFGEEPDSVQDRKGYLPTIFPGVLARVQAVGFEPFQRERVISVDLIATNVIQGEAA